MTLSKKYQKRKSHKVDVIWSKFEVLKCLIYGFIIVTIILIFGNRELFLHNATAVLFKLGNNYERLCYNIFCMRCL